MSFWPAGDIKEELGVIGAMFGGVPASLNFHHNLDYVLEGNREPEQYQIRIATDEDVNFVYERLLEHNGVRPQDVTLERGQELCARREKPEMDLPVEAGTRYCYMPELVTDKIVERSWYDAEAKEKLSLGDKLFGAARPFFHFPQSCVSFCFNLIELADRINEEVCFKGQRHHSDPSDRSSDYRVPWFADDIVKKFYMTSEQRTASCALM